MAVIHNYHYNGRGTKRGAMIKLNSAPSKEKTIVAHLSCHPNDVIKIFFVSFSFQVTIFVLLFFRARNSQMMKEEREEKEKNYLILMRKSEKQEKNIFHQFLDY